MPREFVPLSTAVLTVSDTRKERDDVSGKTLCDLLEKAGHRLFEKAIVKDNRYAIRKKVSEWIASEEVSLILTTGGTGFFETDVTPEAVSVLFDRAIEGFGELFRRQSYEEIGSAAMQSRCVGGMANNTLIFCFPGSPAACKTGWNLLSDQVDGSRFCNFVKVLLKDQSKHPQEKKA